MRYGQFCALARAAELLGERWTLLIVRELLLGPQRFADLRAGLGDVSTSLLAQRLAALHRTGLIRRVNLPPPAVTTVYELTATGAALRPAINELIRWGGRFLLPPRRGETFDPRWLTLALGACARTHGSPVHTVLLVIPAPRGDVAIHLTGGPDGTVVTANVAPADLTVRGDARAVFALATGMQSPAQLADGGALEFEGDRSLLDLVPRFFDTSDARSANPGGMTPLAP